ncbi:hypothetical protein GCM10009823_05520 [Brevibacterium salitolerans]|uniref:SnoaL-like domain-containing protein n=2 Tax=Brevibacteriaceae TaxID=85019 RepID=A0ABP5HY25_9MICO
MAELAQAWLRAFDELDSFRPLCHPDARVWHSTDDAWVSVDTAIANVRSGGGLPPRERESWRVTEDGFLVQFTLALGSLRMHNTILVRVRDGLAYEAEEYVGLEQDVRRLLMEEAGVTAG